MFNRVRGAKLQGGAHVPNKTPTPATFGEIWDSDNYFRPDESKEVLTIPSPRRAGYYQIRVAIRWMNPWNGPGSITPPYPPMEELSESMYYTYVTINGQLLGNEARATANPVRAAAGTTQYFTVDENLNANDRVGVGLWQGLGTDIDAMAFLEIRRLGSLAPMRGRPGAPMAVPSNTSGDTD